MVCNPIYSLNKESALVNELPEESDQFRFLRAAGFTNLKGSVGLILTKVSDMRISIPCPFSFVFYLRVTCWVFILDLYGFSVHHSLNVTFLTFDSRLFADEKKKKLEGVTVLVCVCVRH